MIAFKHLVNFYNWGFAWVSHRSWIDYHWWHSCIVYCAWYNMYNTVGKSQGCRRTQKTFSWIQNFSRIMRLHQGYFFDFSYSQSVQTELKKWTVIFPCLQATTQWRKVQERLEDDERCSRLEKIVRLNIFQVSIFPGRSQFLLFCGSICIICFCVSQEYIRHLEKEEEEQKRIQKVWFSYLIANLVLLFCSYIWKLS